MSRAKYTGTAVTIAADGRSLQIIPNASVTLYTAGTSTPLPETVYAGNTGGTTLTPPFQSDEYGAFEFYLASGKRVKVTVSDGVNTVTMDLEPVLPDPSELVTTAGGVTVPNLTLTSPTINGGTLNSVTLVTPSGVVTPSSSDTLTNKTVQGGVLVDSRFKGPMHDLQAYIDDLGGGSGAIDGGVWTGADNSAALDACLAAALADGGWVFANYIVGLFESSHNIDPRVPIVGLSDDRTRFIPGVGTDDQPFFEVCGTVYGHATWENFGIGDIAMPGRPQCAYVFAECDGSGDSHATTVNSSSEHNIARIKVDGYYTKTGAALLAFSSSKMFDPIFHNNYNDPAATACRLDNQGESGVTSAFGHTFYTGSAVADDSWDHPEFHDASGAADQYALIINGGGSHKFTKAIIGGEGQALVGLKNGPVDLKFDAVTFYSTDVGGAAQCSLYAMDTDPILNVSIEGDSSSVNSAVIGGVQGCVWTGLKVKGHRVIDGGGTGTPIMVKLDGNGGTITAADIDCFGLDVNVGSVAGVIAGDLYRPGTVTALTRSTREYNSSGGLRLAASLTVLGGATIGSTLSVGSGAAGTGTLRLPNPSSINADTVGGGDTTLVGIDATDNVYVGSTSGIATTSLQAQHVVKLVTSTGTKFEGNANGCAVNGATPAGPPSLGSAAGATYTAAEQTLINNLRSWAIASGWCTA